MAPAQHSSTTVLKRRGSPTGLEISVLEFEAAQSGQVRSSAHARARRPTERAATRAIRLVLVAVFLSPFASPRAADAAVAAAQRGGAERTPAAIPTRIRKERRAAAASPRPILQRGSGKNVGQPRRRRDLSAQVPRRLRVPNSARAALRGRPGDVRLLPGHRVVSGSRRFRPGASLSLRRGRAGALGAVERERARRQGGFGLRAGHPPLPRVRPDEAPARPGAAVEPAAPRRARGGHFFLRPRVVVRVECKRARSRGRDDAVATGRSRRRFYGVHRAFHRGPPWLRALHAEHHRSDKSLGGDGLRARETTHHSFVDGFVQVAVNVLVQNISFVYAGPKHDLSRFAHNLLVYAPRPRAGRGDAADASWFVEARRPRGDSRPVRLRSSGDLVPTTQHIHARGDPQRLRRAVVHAQRGAAALRRRGQPRDAPSDGDRALPRVLPLSGRLRLTHVYSVVITLMLMREAMTSLRRSSWP